MDTVFYLALTFFCVCVTLGATCLLLGLIHAQLVKRRYGPQ